MWLPLCELVLICLSAKHVRNYRLSILVCVAKHYHGFNLKFFPTPNATCDNFPLVFSPPGLTLSACNCCKLLLQTSCNWKAKLRHSIHGEIRVSSGLVPWIFQPWNYVETNRGDCAVGLFHVLSSCEHSTQDHEIEKLATHRFGESKHPGWFLGFLMQEGLTVSWNATVE